MTDTPDDPQEGRQNGSKKIKATEAHLAAAEGHVQDFINNTPETEIKEFITNNPEARAKLVELHADRLANKTADNSTVTDIAKNLHAEHIERTDGRAVGKFTKMAQEEYKNLSFIKKGKTAIRANWVESGALEKTGRGAGVAVGLGVGYCGLKNMGRAVGMFAPKVDAEGHEMPVGGGTFVKGAVQGLAGGGIALTSLVVGGKGRAIV